MKTLSALGFIAVAALSLSACEYPANDKLAAMSESVLTDSVGAGLQPLDAQGPAFQSEGSWNALTELVRASATDQDLSRIGDWATLQALNSEAASIWAALLNCNGGDAELARANYYTGKVCPERNDDSLKERIIALHKNIENFLTTTQFLIPKPSRRAAAPSGPFQWILDQFNRELQGISTDYDDADPLVRKWKTLMQSETPLFHPLFSQMMIEYLSVINRITDSPYTSPFAVDYDRNNILLDYEFSNMTTVIRTTELAYWDELDQRKLLDRSESYATARSFTNSWFIYALMAKSSCAQLGLWPELSYASLFVIRGQHIKTSREVARAIEMGNCGGKIPYLNREWREAPLRVNDRDLIVSQRNMGAQYGYQRFDQYQCLYGLHSMTPSRYSCFTVDPAAPTDIDDGKDWAREHFYNPRAARAKAAYDFVSKQ